MPDSPATKLDPWHFPALSKPEGYLFVDHRASPGIPEETARFFDLPPDLVKEGKVFEAATLACGHCPSVFMKNPLRTRERGRCPQHGYICDACEIAAKDPNYVHYSRQEIIDRVASGLWTLTGTTSLPIFTRKETIDG